MSRNIRIIESRNKREGRYLVDRSVPNGQSFLTMKLCREIAYESQKRFKRLDANLLRVFGFDLSKSPDSTAYHPSNTCTSKQ